MILCSSSSVNAALAKLGGPPVARVVAETITFPGHTQYVLIQPPVVIFIVIDRDRAHPGLYIRERGGDRSRLGFDLGHSQRMVSFWEHILPRKQGHTHLPLGMAQPRDVDLEIDCLGSHMIKKNYNLNF
jgi:hypothetical protein